MVEGGHVVRGQGDMGWSRPLPRSPRFPPSPTAAFSNCYLHPHPPSHSPPLAYYMAEKT